jgi:hypothetical protein
MTQVLMIVGLGVFFIIVYGAVMVGGHLLEELERAEPNPEPAAVAQVAAELGPREVRA